ncbi:MAG TPA: sensor domain-containing diguanylate cyclase [Crenotrichaceae bacterium]|nr:sensor domain-containing diguanylate cyclase [Crenotrichaceae bacterium]
MSTLLDQDIANQTLNMSPVGTVIFNADNRITWVNQAMREFVNAKNDQLINLSFSELNSKYLDGFSDHPDLWKVASATSQQSRWLISLDSPQNEANSAQNVRYYVDVTEIMKLKTECRNLKDQLENHSTADLLTGLLNNRSLLQSLEPQVSRSRRYGNPLSVIVMQINDFETNSDTIKPATDQVLTAVSFYLRDQMRWVDLVGRTGDQEFTLILPETTKTDALTLANKINKRLGEMSLPDSPEVTATINAKFGVEEWRKGDDSTILLRKARENSVTLKNEEPVT